MSDTGRNKTISCNAGNGDAQVNLTTYIDKNGEENYVTQLKKNGKEVFLVTKHPDGNVYYTDEKGNKIKIR